MHFNLLKTMCKSKFTWTFLFMLSADIRQKCRTFYERIGNIHLLFYHPIWVEHCMVYRMEKSIAFIK